MGGGKNEKKSEKEEKKEEGKAGKEPATVQSGFKTVMTNKESEAPPAEDSRLVGLKADGPAEVLLMRHGERVDRVFGSGWAKRALDGDDYRPYDLNLPLFLPRRTKSWRNDAPLTEMGCGVARAMGRGLALSRPTVAAPLAAVFCSPALRCVQTAASLLSQVPSAPPIRVEPGLFETVGWYESLPELLSVAELAEAGYPVQPSYRPLMGLAELETLARETNLEYAVRQQRVLSSLLAGWRGTETVLVVGHAPTLALGARLLSGQERRLTGPLTGGERAELHRAGHNFPFCSLLSFVRPPAASSNFYSLNQTLLYNLTATNNASAPDLAYLTRKA